MANFLAPGCILREVPAIKTIVGTILHDEAKHVKISKAVAAELSPKSENADFSIEIKQKVVDFLTPLGDALEKIGINLAPPSRYQDINILQGNGNSMDCFSEQRFDTVLCNARIIGAGRKA